MGLREQAAADLRRIVEDSARGFGQAVTVTAPNGATAELTGLATDVHETIDPDTGQAVVGRRASVSLRMVSITEAGLSVPRGVAETSGKPWVVQFFDIHGNAQTYKVIEAMPDRTLGLVVCLLEAYVP